VDASGDPRIGVPPAAAALVRHGIAVTVEHDMSPLDEQVDGFHIVSVKRSKSYPLSIGFAVAQSPRFKLNDCDQELFAVVCRDYFSV